MIIENSSILNLKSELSHLDEVMEQEGFVRWQWEYYRATYDAKIEHNGEDYYLRINTRVTEGKLESPSAVLEIENVYSGVGTFPHGVNYNLDIPNPVMKIAQQKLDNLQKHLT